MKQDEHSTDEQSSKNVRIFIKSKYFITSVFQPLILSCLCT